MLFLARISSLITHYSGLRWTETGGMNLWSPQGQKMLNGHAPELSFVCVICENYTLWSGSLGVKVGVPCVAHMEVPPPPPPDRSSTLRAIGSETISPGGGGGHSTFKWSGCAAGG